jgi:arylsulfatase A-like enzyme
LSRLLSRRSLLASAFQRPKQPNILLILADDMGFSDAGCYGGDIDTPNLDRLARNGLRYSQMYSTARCIPSRCCLLTGRYPQQVNRDQSDRGPMPSWTRFLPHHLAPLGYRSYHSGKWHITGKQPLTDVGFDHSYLLGTQNGFFIDKDITLDEKPLPSGDPGHYTTIEVGKRARTMLAEHFDSHADKPFFQYIAFTSPHFPLQALQQDIDRYKNRFLAGWDVHRERRWKRMRKQGLVNCDLAKLEPETKPRWNLKPSEAAKVFGEGEVTEAVPWASLNAEQRQFQATKMAIHAAMISRMDSEIGLVLDDLRARKALDNTLVLFLSDNGASAEMMNRGEMHSREAAPGARYTYLCLGPGWASAANSPFRLHKYYTHEGGVSSPMIAHWPTGITAKNQIRHNPGHFVDVLPTLLQAAGGAPVSVSGAPAFEGRSLLPTFAKDNTVSRDYIYFRHDDNRGIRMGDWKAVAHRTNGPWELYNLAKDRCEANNLAASSPTQLTALTTKWQALDDRFKAERA